jgi:cephalosporin hydroxylase
MSNAIEEFRDQTAERISNNGHNAALKDAADAFNLESNKAQYSYNFTWMGRPIIQYPQDMVAMQELIWKIQPDILIETGIAHGGSLIFYASLFELMGKGRVIGIDIDIRDHNRHEIENHAMFKRINMIQGSSIDPNIVTDLRAMVGEGNVVLVCLDSNHTRDHVLEELRLYSQFVTPGSYLVVFDTIVEFLPDDYLPGRPWGKGNNPFTAVDAFLAENSDFERDEKIDSKLLISVAPGGYLRRKNG